MGAEEALRFGETMQEAAMMEARNAQQRVALSGVNVSISNVTTDYLDMVPSQQLGEALGKAGGRSIELLTDAGPSLRRTLLTPEEILKQREERRDFI